MEGNSENNKIKNSVSEYLSLDYAECKLRVWQEIGWPCWVTLPRKRKMPVRIFEMREEITFLYPLYETGGANRSYFHSFK